MRVLIAPDCFGDTLSAVDAVDAIARGWASAEPDDELVCAPQSDGGPGFVNVLVASGGERRTAHISGPLHERVDADWLLDGDTAYIESAQACGLHLLPSGPTVASALFAHSHGVGELVMEAITAGATTIVVGLGGSACTDGGRGFTDALGGLELAASALERVTLIAATDVENPLLGDAGAARVFGPQKGADDATVVDLEERLGDWAEQLATVRDEREAVGAGAAGGLGAALLTLGAVRQSGAELVWERTGLVEQLARAQLVITGEGRLDGQSVRGKLVSSLAQAAPHAPTVVLAGQVQLSPDELRAAGIAGAYSLVDLGGSVEVAMTEADRVLAQLAANVARMGEYRKTEYR